MRPQIPGCHLRRTVHNLQRLWEGIPADKKFDEINLDSAVCTCGYNSFGNGAARTFLLSANLYGLIEYNTTMCTMKFLPLSEKVLKKDADKEKFEATKEAALNPDFYSQLFVFFDQQLCTDRGVVLNTLKQYEFTNSGRYSAANTFVSTMEYLRTLLPKELQKKNTYFTPDGLVSISFPFNYRIGKLEADIKELIDNHKQLVK